MDCDRKHLLGVILADDIVVEDLADFLRGRDAVARGLCLPKFDPAGFT